MIRPEVDVPDLVLVSAPQLYAMTGLTENFIYRNGDPSLPKSVKIGHRRYWRLVEIRAWLDAKFAAAKAV